VAAAEVKRVMNEEDGEMIIQRWCFPVLIFNYLVIVFNFQPSDLILPHVFNPLKEKEEKEQ
jgi:hypothetical protein